MANLAYKKHLSGLLDGVALQDDLLRSIEHQVTFFDNFSPETQIAQIEQSIDQTGKELEQYLHGDDQTLCSKSSVSRKKRHL